MDRLDLPESAEVEIVFLSSRQPGGNAAVIAIEKPGSISLSNGTPATAIAIWDEPYLPTAVVHRIESAGRMLQVYNKYRTRHGPDFITEDSFTGNAGMIVTQTSPSRRRYECSNGPGPFSPDDLIFELSWKSLGS